MAEKVGFVQVTVPESDAGQRLDRWLKKALPEVPYIGIQKLIRQGRVRVNGEKVAATARLEAASVVSFPGDMRQGGGHTRQELAAAYQVRDADAEMVSASTVFEDKWVLVLNKPAGLPAQAGGGQVRSLDRILSGLYGAEKAPKLVHRLDRETTGLIVCAKNRTTAAAMAAQFAGRDVRKEYLAVVVGKLPAKAGEVNAPIAKVGPYARVDMKGDSAHTTWRWLGSVDGNVHLLACVPHTGRMNQLRVHMAYIGLPMLGDDKYGGEAVKAAGRGLYGTARAPLHLHAWKLQIAHPHNGEALHLEAPLPAHMAKVAGLCGWRP